MKRFLYPRSTHKETVLGGFLLFLRLTLGAIFIYAGLQKLLTWDTQMETFIDPFGIGSPASLGLAIFGELVCGILFVIGFMLRFTVIPMFITMCVAFFLVHHADVVAGCASLMYMIILVGMFFTGAGKYSADAKMFYSGRR